MRYKFGGTFPGDMSGKSASPLDKDNLLLFSRDWLEIEVALPGGGTLTVLNNHFKSKLVIEPSPAKKSCQRAGGTQ